MDSKKDIKSLNLEELKTELESMGEKAFRAKQMYEWMHVKMVDSADEMTNLSAKLRAQLKEKTEIALSKLKATPVLTIKNILIKALYLSGHSE